jgi:hypothetical protein
MRARRLITLTATAALALSACGGGDDDNAAEPAADPPAADAVLTSDPSDAAGAEATGSQAADEPTQPIGDASAEPSAEPPPAESAPASGDGGGGDDVAVLVIGDQTYEIDVPPGTLGRCDPDFFGAFWALGGAGEDIGLELLLPPPDDPNFADEVPVITVRDDVAGVEWIADSSREMAGVEAGESQVDGFSVDGSSVTGTATFVDLNASYAFQGGSADEPQPVTGTFRVSCSG